MPEIPRTKFNSPWTVAVIEAALNDVSSAKGSSESLTAALNAMRAEINSLSGGVHLKGAVDYYNNLPASPSEGDAYTVRYQGTSGTDPLGIEYAWATYQGTPQWIPIGVDPSVFAKATDEAEDRAALVKVVDSGAKNFLNANGSFYRETNGWIVGSGVRTGIDCNIPAGDYYLSITVDGQIGSGAIAQLQVLYVDDTVESISNLVSLVSNASSSKQVQFSKNVIKANIYFTGTPATIKNIMICTKAAWDISHQYEPYSKTNSELTVLTDEDRAALVELVDGGAKNLLKLGFTHKSSGYQTADMTADGNGIIVNGDRNTTTDAILVYDLVTNQSNMLDTRYTLPAGKYVIPSTGTQNLRYQVYCHDGTNYQSLGYTMNDPLEFEYTSALKTQYPYLAYRLWASRVSSFDNYTVYPMITTKAAWGISHEYQPYRPSWQAMWDAIQALQSGGNRALTMQTEPEEQEER